MNPIRFLLGLALTLHLALPGAALAEESYDDAPAAREVAPESREAPSGRTAKPSLKDESASNSSPFFPSKPTGWRNVKAAGVWWNALDGTLNGAPYAHPGLLSIYAGVGADYHFPPPVYVGFGAEFYTPQILWKSIGLGVFYFFCFFFTGGKCTANVPFGTGERDLGYVGLTGHVGTRLPMAPLRFYAGPEFGLLFSGLTAFPMSALFVKAGVGFDITQMFAVALQVKRSLLLSQWNFGAPMSLTTPGVWIVDLSVQLWN